VKTFNNYYSTTDGAVCAGAPVLDHATVGEKNGQSRGYHLPNQECGLKTDSGRVPQQKSAAKPRLSSWSSGANPVKNSR